MTTSDPVETISLLGEPVRRRLYDYAVHEPEPASRERAAKAVGTKRSLMPFTWTSLPKRDCSTVEFKRLSGRKGPGDGEAAKLYKKPAQDLEVSLPHREYRLAATLFAQALSSKQSSGEVVKAVARAFGRKLAHEVKERAAPRRGRKNLTRTAGDVLREHGYQPFHDPDRRHQAEKLPLSLAVARL
jgi:predicted ArsR family transcriptional regulator